jgi:hypothetical protein
LKTRIKYMCKNTGYLVTISKSLDIAFFDKKISFQGVKRGNKVTDILQTYFNPFGIRPRQLLVILTGLTRRKVEGGER